MVCIYNLHSVQPSKFKHNLARFVICIEPFYFRLGETNQQAEQSDSAKGEMWFDEIKYKCIRECVCVCVRLIKTQSLKYNWQYIDIYYIKWKIVIKIKTDIRALFRIIKLAFCWYFFCFLFSCVMHSSAWHIIAVTHYHATIEHNSTQFNELCSRMPYKKVIEHTIP